MIDATYHGKPADMVRVVVAVGPAVRTGDGSALTSIIVAGRGVDGRGYVLEDLSGRYTIRQRCHVLEAMA